MKWFIFVIAALLTSCYSPEACKEQAKKIGQDPIVCHDHHGRQWVSREVSRIRREGGFAIKDIPKCEPQPQEECKCPSGYKLSVLWTTCERHLRSCQSSQPVEQEQEQTPQTQSGWKE